MTGTPGSLEREEIGGKQDILANFHGGSLQSSIVRLNLGADGPGHDQLGKERWDLGQPMPLAQATKVGLQGPWVFFTLDSEMCHNPTCIGCKPSNLTEMRDSFHAILKTLLQE